MLEITKTNKLIAVLAIAAAFFATEIAVGFLTRSLALVADAFHIMSDIIGYIVAIIAVKLAGTATPSIRFTYGYQRAEVIGAFFNGGEALVGLADVAFLMALGVSVILQSIERFIEPAEVTDPVLVMAIGAAGIGSNALMLLVLGGEPLLCHADPGHGHDHSSPAETAQPTDGHSGHAHVRRAAPIKGRDLNILGVLIHILGDALNSIAVIISAGIYKATGFIYADPIASLFVGIMILGTAWPLLRRSGESLFDAVPGSIDVQGVQEDIERISGSKSVHDLHVWSLDDKNVLATFHLGLDEANYNRQEAMMEDIRADPNSQKLVEDYSQYALIAITLLAFMASFASKSVLIGLEVFAAGLVAILLSPTTSQAVQLGLVGLLTRPVLKAVFPSAANTKELVEERSAQDKDDSPRSSYSSPDTELLSPVSSAPSVPVQVVPLTDAGAREHERLNEEIDTHQPKAPLSLGAPIESPVAEQPVPKEPVPTIQQHFTAVPEIPTDRPVISNNYLPRLYSTSGTYPIKMNNQDELAHKVNGMTLDERLATEQTNGEYEERPRSMRQPSYKEPSYKEQSYREPSFKGSRPASRIGGDYDEPSRSYSKAAIPVVTTYDEQAEPDYDHRSKAASIKRPASRAASVRGSQVGNNVGDIINTDRQHELQGGRQPSVRQPSIRQPSIRNGVQLHDDGIQDRQMSPRPRSAFGYRPEPNLASVQEDGRDSRAGQLGRNGTVLSRAGTMGRNGTLSRGANGGTIGSRRGAFGRGAGASVGTQPEEVLGRDDIHARAEVAERILDESALRRLATMEKKDAKRLSKVIRSEGKAEAKAVASSIKELERLVKLQKEAASAERKSQLRLTKWTSKEHKARLRFLKEKERYERIEGELRNAENDYEERRDHAGGLTSQVAEKTQDLDDLRGQKAADDREREVKLLALKNPAHS